MKLNQRGFSLVEVLVSVAILGVLSAGILTALGSSSKALITTDERETAKNIAEMQMEYVKNQPYAASYTLPDISGTYPGYSDAVDTDDITSRDGDIQKITLTVRHDTRTIITLTGNKVRS